MHSLRTMIGVAVSMLAACLLAVAAVVVCPRCGYEQPEHGRPPDGTATGFARDGAGDFDVRVFDGGHATLAPAP